MTEAEKEWIASGRIVQKQVRETVTQQAAGVGCRSATITCPCGIPRGIMLMYQCLYCKIWFCDQCAEVHFGKTVAEYRAEKQAYRERVRG